MEPPFGDPFHDPLANLQDDERLDLGCALEHGAFAVEGADGEVKTSEAETALAFFCLGLLDQLQKAGYSDRDRLWSLEINPEVTRRIAAWLIEASLSEVLPVTGQDELARPGIDRAVARHRES